MYCTQGIKLGKRSTHSSNKYVGTLQGPLHLWMTPNEVYSGTL